MAMRRVLQHGQGLVMIPLLRQTIQFLQLSTLELEQVVRKELEENPLLEELPEEKQEVDGEAATATAEMALPLIVPSHPEVTDGDATGAAARAGARDDPAPPADHPVPAAVHPRARAGRAQGAGGEPAPRGAARREAGGGRRGGHGHRRDGAAPHSPIPP